MGLRVFVVLVCVGAGLVSTRNIICFSKTGGHKARPYKYKWRVEVTAPYRQEVAYLREYEECWIDFSRLVRLPRVRPPRGWGFLYDLAGSAQTAIIIIFLIFTFVLKPVGVSGNSMNPTLYNGDWLAVSSINRLPKRGDIVVVTQPNDLHEPLIKRVIAVGGDVIDIDFDTHEVFVNGHLQDEPYIAEPTARRFDLSFPIEIPHGSIFLMGDNRNDSLDSRSSVIGLIDERYVFGIVKVRIYPFSSFERMGQQ